VGDHQPRLRPLPPETEARVIGAKALMTRILIVDDNPRVRAALRMCLIMNEGWEVCGEAENGQDAVTAAQDLRPDVVLLDYAMPGLNGVEAARLMSSSVPEARIILFTMFASKQLAALAKSAGVRAVVSKDVGGVNALVEVITKIASEAA
jgi:DNA-binding NarL/FixJ family response regulator